MREREISLVDMIFDILLRWRVIVIAMLIGAIVLGGFGYVSSYRAYNAQVAEVEAAKKQVEEEMVELKETQVHNIHSVLLYEKAYEDALAHMKEDVWMQAKSAQVFKTELTFKVSAATSERTNNIERVYEDAVVSGELKERLARVLKSTTAAVGDVYSFVRGTGSLAEGGDTFRVSVSHYEEAICEKLAQEVKDFVEEKSTAFQESLGSHEILVVNESVAELTDTDMWNYQNQYYKDLMNQKNNIDNMKAAFSLYERQYYDTLANGEFSDSTEDVPDVTVNPGLSLKYIILGMILGAFVLLFWYFMVYILNGKLRASDNLQDIYNIPQLGQIKGALAKKKLFGFVDNWIISLRDYNKRKFTQKEAIELATAAVKIAASKEGLDAVYMVGCDLKANALEVCEQMKAQLSKENICTEVLNNVLYDAQAMSDLEHAKGVVLLETVGSTLYSEIAQELELLKRQGIHVLGGILVE